MEPSINPRSSGALKQRTVSRLKTSNPWLREILTISPKTMDIVKRGLWEAVNTRKGTARGIKLNQYPISGKTGTAQLVTSKEPEIGETEKKDGLFDQNLPHAWFVAYAPSEAPRIAVAVIVEHGEHGSTAAAPIAKELIKTYLEKQERNNWITMAQDPTSSAGWCCCGRGNSLWDSIDVWYSILTGD